MERRKYYKRMSNFKCKTTFQERIMSRKFTTRYFLILEIFSLFHTQGRTVVSFLHNENSIYRILRKRAKHNLLVQNGEWVTCILGKCYSYKTGILYKVPERGSNLSACMLVVKCIFTDFCCSNIIFL